MTVKADTNAHIIPITTHASKPRLPKTVEAKKSGSGMMRSMTTSGKEGRREERKGEREEGGKGPLSEIGRHKKKKGNGKDGPE